MKYCPECGAKLDGNPKYCTECGAKFTTPAESERESIKISKGKHGMELLLDDEIDIDSTAIQLFELHYANVWKPYRTKIQVFEKQKSYEEIKKLFRPITDPDILKLFLMLSICGWMFGLIFGSLIGFSNFPAIIVIVIFSLSIYFALLLEIRQNAKWVYFPTPKKIIFVGKFTREDIEVFKKLIVLKKK